MMGRYIFINFHIIMLRISMKLGMAERQSKPFQKFLVFLRLINFLISQPH